MIFELKNKIKTDEIILIQFIQLNHRAIINRYMLLYSKSICILNHKFHITSKKKKYQKDMQLCQI